MPFSHVSKKRRAKAKGHNSDQVLEFVVELLGRHRSLMFCVTHLKTNDQLLKTAMLR